MEKTREKIFNEKLATEHTVPTFKSLVTTYKAGGNPFKKAPVLFALVDETISGYVQLIKRIQFLTEIATELTQIEPSKELRDLALKLFISRLLPKVVKFGMGETQEELWHSIEFLSKEPNLPNRISHAEKNQIAALMGLISILPCFEDHSKFPYETYVKAMINTGTIHAIFSQSPLRDFQNSISQSWFTLRAVRPQMFDALPILIKALRQLKSTHNAYGLFSGINNSGFLWMQTPEVFRTIRESSFFWDVKNSPSTHAAFAEQCLEIQAYCAGIVAEYRCELKFDAPEYRLAEACTGLLQELIYEIYHK